MLKKSRLGFTLVELLVVIAIIGILIGMLLPAVQQVREAARRTQCSNQMRQMTLAMMNYESAHQHLPPGIQTGEGDFASTNAQPGLNWYVLIFPFAEQQAQFDVIDELTDGLSNPDAAFNSVEKSNIIPFVVCPSCPMDPINPIRPDGDVDAAKSNYIGIWGTEVNGNSDYDNLAADPDVFDSTTYSGVLFLNSEVSLAEISDGTSNTLIIGERDGSDTDSFTRAAATWCSGRRARWGNQCLGPVSGELDYVINTVEDNNRAQWNAVSSTHPGGVVFGRADGSVSFVTETVDGDAYEAFGTKSDGEIDLSF